MMQIVIDTHRDSWEGCATHWYFDS